MTPAGRTGTPPAFQSDPVRVVVPASSANLGPGFDAVGLALDLHDEMVAMISDDPGVIVEVDGEGAATLPRDETHLVARVMRRAFAAMGAQPPGFVLRCHNVIPHGRGLGSSAAATVGGLVLARALVADGRERLDDHALLDLACAIEGHPDNAAAALLGGFTLAWIDSSADGSTGRWAAAARAVRLEPHPQVVPVVAVPVTPVATAVARRLLPATVPHADAAFNVGRAALLVHALVHEPSLLMAATEDRLHQQARQGAYPESHQLVLDLRAEGVPAVISGAGPTVLALATADTARTVPDLAPAGWVVRGLAVDRRGAYATAAP